MAPNRWPSLGGLLVLTAILSGCATLPSGHASPAVPTTPTSHTRPKGLEAIPDLIRAGHLARADEWYASYRSEHEESRGIPTAIVMLAQAHLRAREYLLTRFYLNEYRRDFPSGQERAGLEYLGLRSLYLQYRSMQDDRIGAAFYAQAKAYRQMFPHSSYRAKVRKLEREMHRIQNKRYRDLAKYYARIGKAKAAAIYQAKISDAGEVSSGK